MLLIIRALSYLYPQIRSVHISSKHNTTTVAYHYNDTGYSKMDNPGRLVITIIDEGHMQKSFSLSPQTGVTELLNHYRNFLCPICTNPNSLQFWHETTKASGPSRSLRSCSRHVASALAEPTKIEPNTPAGTLSIRDGDIIDVSIPQQVTRGACPLPPAQTLPNIHYLGHAVRSMGSSTIRPVDFVPNLPNRVKLRFEDCLGASLTLQLKRDTKFLKVLEAWAKHTRREVRVLRLLHDGDRVDGGLSIRDYEVSHPE